ncbi:response regulator [Fundidesulfovibrio terrae]|uniref:response regulator n=1 Tax=Fundidesulfovibrio terrae TaxID=2922866 RepID=UPI001FB03852|nr:response regulator [Fundidesulfovibrio terrae]
MNEGADTSTSHPSLNILFAEDDYVSRMLVEEIFRLNGHTVTSVVTGHEVLKALKLEKFDIIFMDVSMPRLDGIKATKRIREDTSGLFDPAIPIVAMTGHVLPSDRDRIMEAGMDDFIAKPIDISELSKILNKFVARIEDARSDSPQGARTGRPD